MLRASLERNLDDTVEVLETRRSTPAPARIACRSSHPGAVSSHRPILPNNRGVFDEFDYVADSAYALSLSPSDREGAATDIAIRADDGADLVIEVRNRTQGRISAYLSVDQAEDLLAALTEIVRLPSDRTGSLDTSGPVRAPDDGVPTRR